mmetsp:Transcript_38082/g.81113  ORF Transcript_38082/g.81113 Transcript_38082/m.81113 type:complete len:204 (+) Transcript_38082:680-1291(+)
MGTHDEVEVMLLQELANHVGAEGVRDAAVVLGPTRNVSLRIGPQQITQQPCVGNVRWPHDALDLLRRVEVRRKTRMYAEDLLVHHSRKGKDIEHLLEFFPHLDVVAALALVIEAVDAVDGCTLVVTAEEEEILGVLDLVREKQAHAFEAILPTVNIVAEEEIIGVGRETTVLKEAKQIVVLPMDVAHDLDGRLKLKERGLVHE